MTMPRTVFLFKRGRKSRILSEEVPATAYPTEFFYGYVQLAAAGNPVELLDEDDVGLSRRMGVVWKGLSAICYWMTGVHPWAVWKLAQRSALARLNEYDALVATTNTFGIALGVLKMLNLLRGRVFFIVMGVCEERPSTLKHWLFGRLFRKLDVIVISKGELDHLRRHFGAHVAVRYLPFGVDRGYWTPDAAAETEPYVLSVGNDPKRDFPTLIKAWKPVYPLLKIVTGLALPPAGENVEIIAGDWRRQLLTDDEVRRLFREALFVVVPLRETTQPSGQSVCLQAMACGKAVILSRISGLWDRDVMQDGVNCVLVDPGSVEALRREIDRLLTAPDRIEVIGRNARAAIEDHLNVTVMADALRAILTSPHASASYS